MNYIHVISDKFLLSSNFIFFCIILLEQYYFTHLQKNWPSAKSAIKNLPSGSTSFAIFSASELAKSEFAGDTANIRQFGLVINCINMLLISISISAGWSPTGTFVMPGRSTRVKFSTKTFKKFASKIHVLDLRWFASASAKLQKKKHRNYFKMKPGFNKFVSLNY